MLTLTSQNGLLYSIKTLVFLFSYRFFMLDGNLWWFGQLPISEHCPVKLYESLLNVMLFKFSTFCP